MAEPACQKLLAENARLRRENAALRGENKLLCRRVATLEARVQQLTRLFDEALRKAKRQAAPFSKGPPKARPKKPGRKPGDRYGARARRPVPPPETIEETCEAPLPEACPHCGGAVEENRVDHQYQVEIPRRPLCRRFNVHIGVCRGCGRRLQGRHPLQTSDALGAAAAGLGPDAQAAAVFLNKRLGLSCGKVKTVFKELFGIDVSRGGVAQIAGRAARKGAPLLEEIHQALRDSEQVTPDETGWRVGGHKAWLHTLASDQATWYAIDPGRSGDVAAGILGWDWNGTLVHDGWEPYEHFTKAMHQQCLAHALRRAKELLAVAAGRAAEFPRQVIRLFRQALRWRDRYEARAVSAERLDRATLRLADKLRRLTSRPRTHPGNERFAAHLHRHLWDWFTFLVLPGTDATNHRAEQALRYAVANRKVWGGNRTWLGAAVQAALMSLIETCRQQGHCALDFLSQLLRGLRPQLILQT